VSHPIESTHPDRIAALHAIRDRFPGNVAFAQETRLLVSMQELGHVTTFEASRYLDVYHSPARKLSLVKRGCQILTTWRRVPTESGRSHRIGVYSLAKGKEQRSAAQVDCT
jgi:hypothetical protein